MRDYCIIVNALDTKYIYWIVGPDYGPFLQISDDEFYIPGTY